MVEFDDAKDLLADFESSLIEAHKAAAVLGANYPGSKWYRRSFELMQRHAPATAAAQPTS